MKEEQVQVDHLPNHQVTVVAELVDGRPTVVGIHIVPIEPLWSGSGLTQQKLSKIPIGKLAVDVAGISGDEMLAMLHKALQT